MSDTTAILIIVAVIFTGFIEVIFVITVHLLDRRARKIIVTDEENFNRITRK